MKSIENMSLEEKTEWAMGVLLRNLSGESKSGRTFKEELRTILGLVAFSGYIVEKK
jgi:hypothetical protein